MTVTSASAPGFSVPRSMPRTRAGLMRQFLDQLRPGQMARLDQRLDADRQQRFQADDAVGGLVEFAHLLFRGVRGVVGGDHVERAVLAGPR